MGTKEKRKRQSLSDSGSSEDETGHTASKKSKKHKKEKKAAKDKLKEAKKFLKQKKKESRGKGQSPSSEDAPLASDAQIESLNSGSYFEKNPEFTAWLLEDKGIFFNTLPGTDARELFEEFVKQWNDRKLPAKYYKGISPAQARRSRHSWGIQGGGKETIAVGLDAALDEEREEKSRDQKAGKWHWKGSQQQEMAQGPSRADAEGVPSVVLQAQRSAAMPESSRLGKLEDERMAKLKTLAARGPIQIQRRV